MENYFWVANNSDFKLDKTEEHIREYFDIIVHRAEVQTLNRRHPLSYVTIYITLIYKKFICRFQTLTIFKDTRAYTTSRDVSKYRKKNKIQSRSKKELSDNVKNILNIIKNLIKNNKDKELHKMIKIGP